MATYRVKADKKSSISQQIQKHIMVAYHVDWHTETRQCVFKDMTDCFACILGHFLT